MIDARQLMIGNWVSVKMQYQQITAIGKYDRISTTDWDCHAKDLTPIPLTEEILGKCGFVLKSKYSYWNFSNEKGFGLSMWMRDDASAGFEKKGVCYWGEQFIPMTYLHQLQNLYYCLCQKELEISL